MSRAGSIKRPNWGARIAVCALIVAVSLVLIALFDSATGSGSYSDGRDAWVHIGNGVSRHCDGTTLVYESNRGGVAVIPKSPECTQ